MRPERNTPVRRYWVALILLLLGSLAGAWHNRAVDRGRQDLMVTATRMAVAPPATLAARASRWLGEQTDWLLHGHGLGEENRLLKRRVEQLESENAQLREARISYERLRGDLRFVRQTQPSPLAADVIGRRPDPKFDTIIINRGSQDGIGVNSVVVTARGLVGRVFETTPCTASVLMLTDQHSAAGARVQRAASRATGICKGDNSDLLSVVYLRNDADIKSGDVIVTSGLGGVFPPGLPIGVVTSIAAEDGNILKRARVRPQVDFDRLEEVYVLQ